MWPDDQEMVGMEPAAMMAGIVMPDPRRQRGRRPDGQEDRRADGGWIVRMTRTITARSPSPAICYSGRRAWQVLEKPPTEGNLLDFIDGTRS
jgi:hypothetical protein